MKRRKRKYSKEDVLKAMRKGSRDAELENQTGWSSKHKVHKSLKQYSRKKKHRNCEY